MSILQLLILNLMSMKSALLYEDYDDKISLRIELPLFVEVLDF